jgi:hypothetical protein
VPSDDCKNGSLRQQGQQACQAAGGRHRAPQGPWLAPADMAWLAACHPSCCWWAGRASKHGCMQALRPRAPTHTALTQCRVWICPCQRLYPALLTLTASRHPGHAALASPICCTTTPGIICSRQQVHWCCRACCHAAATHPNGTYMCNCAHCSCAHLQLHSNVLRLLSTNRWCAGATSQIPSTPLSRPQMSGQP